MQFPETTVNNLDEFSQWHLSVREAIESNTHDIQQLEVTPKGNGEFDVQLKVNWQAQTLEGEAMNRVYRQQWKIVTDERKRLLIQDYIVEEVISFRFLIKNQSQGCFVKRPLTDICDLGIV